MKILLVYVFLQAAMPSYLLACSRSENKQSLQAQNLYRRYLGVQPTQGHQGSVGKLQRSHHRHGGQHHHHTHPSDDSSNSDGHDRSRRTKFSRRALYRRGDYSMLQSKHSPIGNLHRRQIGAPGEIPGDDEGANRDNLYNSSASSDDDDLHTRSASLGEDKFPQGDRVLDRLGKLKDQAEDKISKWFY
ncbi:hypothetical protein IWQ61_009236 [Dispira simplex]|nr:hypothetical protein IWQ61_009236 [Dispira simplex]